MRTSSFLSVLVLAAVFASVTAGWRGSEDISAQTNSPKAGLTVGVSVSTDKASYAAGESIVIELIVFNRTAQSLTFDFRNAQHYDFIIEDTEGTRVRRWAEGRMFAQVLGEETLEPGREEVVYTETYAERLQPGGYKIIGALISTNRPLSASLMITIE